MPRVPPYTVADTGESLLRLRSAASQLA
jgi:hypothetical protein